MRVSFIGTVGVPNRYGGFEAFLEHCAPLIVENGHSTTVTCYSGAYADRSIFFRGVRRVFLGIPANGAASILHDLVAFLCVFWSSSHIVVLGVSGGPWFPFFRLACALTGKKLLVNIDGVEWKRGKFSKGRKLLLRIFDALAQFSANVIIYDNGALLDFVIKSCRKKAFLVAYPGDHVLRVGAGGEKYPSALTVCRIEPENNIEMLIKGFLGSAIGKYTIVGNWNGSEYGRQLKAKYAGRDRLNLCDPVYDPQILAEMRDGCSVYLHGHSVGGTNPSLVEMLFYDCRILCYDVPYHRETAGQCAEYFSDEEELTRLLESPLHHLADRSSVRKRYSRSDICRQYLNLLAR